MIRYSIVLISLILIPNLIHSQNVNINPENGDRLRIGYVRQQPPSLNPMQLRSSYDHELRELIFGSGLFNIASTGEVVHSLALSSEFQNGNSWYVTLRPGLTFHDRSRLTSRDVKFTFDLYRKFSLQMPELISTRYIQSIEILTDYSFRIKLHEPLADFRETIGRLPILPEAHYRQWLEHDDAERLPDLPPVGSGYFVFRRMTEAGEIFLDAYNFHAARRPYLDGIIIRFYDTYNDLVNAFIEEDIDLIQITDNSVYRRIRQILDSVNLILAEQDNLTLYYILLNSRVGPFDDTRVRRAMNFAVNRPQMVQKNVPNTTEAGFNLLNEGSNYFFPNQDEFKYNPFRSLSLLENAGYRIVSNGRLSGNQPELFFEFLFADGSPLQEALVRLIAINLGELGIKIEPIPMDPVEIRNRMRRGRFQAALTSYSYDPLKAETALREFYLEELNPGPKTDNYNIRSIDQVLNLTRKPLAMNQLIPNLNRIQYLFNQYAPCIFLFFEIRGYYAIHPRFNNTYFQYQSDRIRTKLTPKHDWFVPKNQQKY